MLTKFLCWLNFGHLPRCLVWRERLGPGKWQTVVELSCRCRRVVESRVVFPYYDALLTTADSREEALRQKPAASQEKKA